MRLGFERMMNDTLVDSLVNFETVQSANHDLPCDIVACSCLVMINSHTFQRERYWICITKKKEIMAIKVAKEGYELIHSISAVEIFQNDLGDEEKVRLVVNNRTNEIPFTASKVHLAVYNS